MDMEVNADESDNVELILRQMIERYGRWVVINFVYFRQLKFVDIFDEHIDQSVSIDVGIRLLMNSRRPMVEQIGDDDHRQTIVSRKRKLHNW